VSSEQLAEWVAEAARELQADFDGQSSCALAKAGRSAGTRKAAEGRWAALREVQCRAAAGESPTLAASQLLESWDAELRRHQANNSSADWITYRAGGVAALAEWLTAEGVPAV